MERGTTLFGFNISALPKWKILVIGIFGVFCSFMLQGTAHELIFNKYKLKDSLFLTFIQFLLYSSFSFRFFIDLYRGKTKLHAPFWFYFITALFLVGSMALSNFSLEHISYPTQVLFRSGKLIPVMLGSFFFLHKRYSPREIMSAILIVLGLIGISLGDKKAQNKFDGVGIFAVIAGLVCDAFASNFEDIAFSKYNAPQSEVIAMIYIIGALFIGLVSIPAGQFFGGIKDCTEHPGLFVQILIFSCLGAIGIQFVYMLINTFGSVITVMITSLRKAFSVCLSFVMFPEKVFTKWHFISILLMSAGIGMNIYNKKKSSKRNERESRMNVSYNGSVDQLSELDKQSNFKDSILTPKERYKA